MTLLQKFFSKDNFTAKALVFLTWLPTILALMPQFFHVSNTAFLIITLVSGVSTTASYFLKSAPAFTWSLFWTFLYTLVIYVLGQPELVQLFPDGQQWIGFLGSVARLFAPMTTQKPGDATVPPSATPPASINRIP